ncbi:hypothetical protein [Streptomyces sp. NPDC059080]|uniref:hypothetical protein n=1 Tax=Streptomyces sp. NPDC059080 TaxID=3346718 RepID=UPI00369BD937
MHRATLKDGTPRSGGGGKGGVPTALRTSTRFSAASPPPSPPLQLRTNRLTHKRLQYFRDTLHGANTRATTALANWMRTHGGYLPELHAFLLSAVHTDKGVAFVLEARDRSLDTMRQMGHFTS